MPHKVFICHSSKDKHVANAACAALEARRVPCWIAPRDILGGVEYGKAIVEAISTTEIMLLIFSRSSNDSTQCRKEIERAVSKEKIVLPFRIEDVLPSDAMEYHLMNTHWLDALTPPMEQRISELCDNVVRLLQTAPSQTPLWTAQDERSAQPVGRGSSRKALRWKLALAALLLVAVAAGGALFWQHQAKVGSEAPVVDTTPHPPPPVPHDDSKHVVLVRKPPEEMPKVPPHVIPTPPDQNTQPPGPPPLTAEQKARLDNLTQRLNALSDSASGVNSGISNLQQSMRSQGLNLNSKWLGLQTGMNNNLIRAQAALKQQDADGAERYAAIAESDAQQLKSFLGTDR